MSAVLEIEELSAGYRGALAVRDLSLTVAEGQVVALVGPNGAGKTTTLKAISGGVRETSGAIRVGDADVLRMAPHRIARLGVGHIPEDGAVFPSLTVAEHFKLGYRGERLDIGVAYRYFPALEELRNRRAALLSGGERQMLAISRALARSPRLLLIDELSLGLAPVIVEEMLPHVRRFADETRAGVLLVEQHVELALGIADRCHVLSGGTTRLERDAADLRGDRQLLLASYLGEKVTGDASGANSRKGVDGV